VVEARKMVDTRSARWVLAAVALIAIAAVTWRATGGSAPFEVVLSYALIGVQMLLPVLGVLAMTTEWTQRTALTTFTTVPQRGRVVVAKLAAAALLACVLVLSIAALALLASGRSGETSGDADWWSGAGRLVAAGVLSNVSHVVMGAAFGAVAQRTAPAIVAYYVAPVLWSAVSFVGLGEHALWLDVFLALGALSQLSLGEDWPQHLVAFVVWIVIPLTAGAVHMIRREVS
jgi:hypothetical protein